MRNSSTTELRLAPDADITVAMCRVTYIFSRYVYGMCMRVCVSARVYGCMCTHTHTHMIYVCVCTDLTMGYVLAFIGNDPTGTLVPTMFKPASHGNAVLTSPNEQVSDRDAGHC